LTPTGKEKILELNSMESSQLPELVHRLIVEENFKAVEELLLKARAQAEAEADVQTLEYVFAQLIGLCHLSEPPAWDKALALSGERERWLFSAHNELQTAMVLQLGIEDYARSIPKLEAAIAHGRAEGDEKTVYTSLCLLGQARLRIGFAEAALEVLSELEAMVGKRGAFVVGDETLFLEELRARRLALDRVSRLASILAAACRDHDFKKRLQELAIRSSE
jgi:hypothetical protein